MKKFMLVAVCVLAAGCGRVMETKEFGNTNNPPPTINVDVNIDNDNSSTSNGGNSNSSGNSTTATGGGASAGNSSSNANNSGSSNNTNSGSASNQANNSTNNSSDNTNSNTNTSTNSQVQNVSQSQDVDVDVELELMAGILGGRVYEAPIKRNGTCKCKGSDKLKENSNGKKFCVKKPKKAKQGLSCGLYDLMATKPNFLPNFSTMTPVYKFNIDQLDVADQDWAGGFPKINDSSVRSQYLEWYGVRCTGKLKIAAANTYTFSLTADDGAILTIDGSPLVLNDGLHSAKTVSANKALAVGSYPIQIDYFQGPRTRIALLLEYSSPSMPKSVIGSSVLSH